MRNNVRNPRIPPRTAALAFGLLSLCIGGGIDGAQAHDGEISPANARTTSDWRDQVIYFAMIDRFDDGEPANNDQGAGEYDPADARRYSGGDLAGLSRRLDYIRGLGATALWITPPVRHQWWDTAVGYGGYHGYWAQHFMEVDPHFGTLEDYRALARGLHARGMRLVQDIVVNHVGNYFRYPTEHDPRRPEAGFEPNTGALPTQRPTQWPFDQNDARDPAQRGLDIYHWTPAIRDYADPIQLLDWQMADLDDLNTENPLVRRALRASYGHWMREVGVDAFRVDTAFYVPPAYFRDFLYAEDAQAPGVMRLAQQLGREDFFLFGEGFAIDRAYEESQSRRIESYVADAEGPLLPAMINFPLYGSLGDAFARARPPAELADRIQRMLRVHADPHRMPSFIDNHDVERFLAAGSEPGLWQALLAMFTLPGIPVIYYGTEQGFTRMRGSMFAAGWGSDGRDHFNTDSPQYRLIQRLAELRANHPPLRRGSPRILAAESAQPGTIAWLSEHEGETLLVALNSSAQPALLGAVDTGIADGRWAPVFAIEGRAPDLQADAEGRIDQVLPAHAGWVWRLQRRAEETQTTLAAPRPQLQVLGEGPARETLRVLGHAEPGQRLALVQDGEIARAIALTADARGRIEHRLDVRSLSDPRVQHRLQLWDAESGRASAVQTFQVEPQWQRLAQASDPIGDDHGPEGRYVLPQDPGWQARGLLDLRAATLEASGGSLRIEVELGGLSQDWNPANGFDRMALTLYLSLPDHREGARVLPLQSDSLPDGRRWHRRLRVHGWSNLLTSHRGADAQSEGEALGAAIVEVLPEQSRLRLSLPARLLGEPTDFAGARLLITTWDYDAGYRRLTPEGGQMAFGGGDGRRDPLWMDALELEVPGAARQAR